MMMKKLISFSIYLVVFLMIIGQANAGIGNTTIAKWKDNKKGAYSLRFDDSMMSHHDHTIPSLVERGLVATFYINPGLERYGYGIDSWESLASRLGIELAPHTMNHTGAAHLAEVEYEIGESFRIVWDLNPPGKSKMLPFNRGGWTTWPSGSQEIQDRYPIAYYSRESVSGRDRVDSKELVDFARRAMIDDAWHVVVTHGTGPNLEWLGIEVSNFYKLLDYLASVKDELWIGNVGDIYKYITQRKTARVDLIESGSEHIRLDLFSDADPVFYDYPLTLITEVPSTWSYCHINQNGIQSIFPVEAGKVMYEAFTNRGEIVLRNSLMDVTPPSRVVVRDGTGSDIGVSPYTTKISSNWDAAVDKESGISRYWYKIGTTPGGSEVLDWIDNGLARSFTTSRTNFSLIRGKKYYVTVKAVNGVGLSSESTSNGFEIGLTHDYISFYENFNNGYLNQWDIIRPRTGSLDNLLYISDSAAISGFGLMVRLTGSSNQPYIVKHNITAFDDVFTRFYLKLNKDFKMPEEGGRLQILELRDGSGEYVSGVYIGYNKDTGIHIYATSLDNHGFNNSLPSLTRDYPLSFALLDVDKWHRVDLRTIAHEGKGGVEFWLNGTRRSSITNRFTDGKEVKSLSIGAIMLPEGSVVGKIYFDDITMSDSLLE
jgi:hypothetical protein